MTPAVGVPGLLVRDDVAGVPAFAAKLHRNAAVVCRGQDEEQLLEVRPVVLGVAVGNGQATCRCATDPAARHGPYHEWSRRKDGRLVHSVLAPDQVSLIQRAIANRREIERLLASWEDESTFEILRPNPVTS